MMMKQARNATRERLALALFSVAAGSVLLTGACSLTLDTSTTQCQSDQDCRRFTGSVCNVTNRVCVAPRDAGTSVPDVGSTADAVASCIGPNGCFACTPNNESEILSHCTDSTCVPFDNNRLMLMGSDSALRPLPR
jgi:hypothetical protein